MKAKNSNQSRKLMLAALIIYFACPLSMAAQTTQESSVTFFQDEIRLDAYQRAYYKLFPTKTHFESASIFVRDSMSSINYRFSETSIGEKDSIELVSKESIDLLLSYIANFERINCYVGDSSATTERSIFKYLEKKYSALRERNLVEFSVTHRNDVESMTIRFLDDATVTGYLLIADTANCLIWTCDKTDDYSFNDSCLRKIPIKAIQEISKAGPTFISAFTKTFLIQFTVLSIIEAVAFLTYEHDDRAELGTEEAILTLIMYNTIASFPLALLVGGVSGIFLKNDIITHTVGIMNTIRNNCFYREKVPPWIHDVMKP